MGSITSSNAIYMLAVVPVYPIPQQLQGFSADNVFGTDPLESSEVQMGVDGVLSAGFVFVAVKQQITLMADSLSNDVFENWYASQQVFKETYRATGIVILPAIGKKWTMNNGVLTTYPPIPDANRVLQPRRYGITWESVSPAVAA